MIDVAHLFACDRTNAALAENRKLASALGAESERLTALMDSSHAILTILTSDAAKDLPPIIKMAVNGFMRAHPEVAPKEARHG